MTFQLFKQSGLAISLILFSLFVIACAGKNETNNQTSPANANVQAPNVQAPNVQTPVPAAAENRNASSNEFEGTAGSVFHKTYNGGPVLLREIRTAEQDGFDRVVFEFDGPEIPNYQVEYVDKPVHQCGSGDVVQVAGDGWLEIRFNPANAHTEAGQPTIAYRERSLSLPILKELEITCDFEAEVAMVLGVSSPNRYRVLNLSDPTRVVIDIKHKNR